MKSFYSMLAAILLAQFVTAGNCAAEDFDSSGIYFEHWRHYDSQGIPCSECHTLQADRTYSLPGHPVCETCHPPGKENDYIKATGDTCHKCHPKDSSLTVPLLSKIVRKNRSFYHSEHTLDLCSVCHRGLIEDTMVMGALLRSQEERNKVRRKSHRFHNLPDCQDCHGDGRTTATRPASHGKDWLKTGHVQQGPLFNCRICHSKSYCQNCHENTY